MITVSDDCYRCGDCVKACPVPGTITNILPGKVRINSMSCIDCNQCLPVCRFGYLTQEAVGAPVAPTPPAAPVDVYGVAAVTVAPATKPSKRKGR